MNLPEDILEKSRKPKIPLHVDMYYCEISPEQAEDIKQSKQFPEFQSISKQYSPPAHGFMTGFAEDFSPYGIGVWGDTLSFGERRIRNQSILAVKMVLPKDPVDTIGRVVWTTENPAIGLNAGVCLFDLEEEKLKVLKAFFFEQ